MRPTTLILIQTVPVTVIVTVCKSDCIYPLLHQILFCCLLQGDKTMCTWTSRWARIRPKKSVLHRMCKGIWWAVKAFLCSSSTMTHKCFEATTQGHSVTEETPVCLWADSAWPLSRVRKNLKPAHTPTHTLGHTITHLFCFVLIQHYSSHLQQLLVLISTREGLRALGEKAWIITARNPNRIKKIVNNHESFHTVCSTFNIELCELLHKIVS